MCYSATWFPADQRPILTYPRPAAPGGEVQEIEHPGADGELIIERRHYPACRCPLPARPRWAPRLQPAII